MEVKNLANLSENDFAELEKTLTNHRNLGQVLAWANTLPKEYFCKTIVAEVITQDEYTHDVIVPFQDVVLVYDTT
jgi:hypothetical protein